MTVIKIEIDGLAELKASLVGKQEVLEVSIQDAIEDTILDIRNTLVKAINSGPASGRVYKRYNPTRTHQASAPGEAPMTDTGALVSSIQFNIAPLVATVGSNLAYAWYLEFGTRRIAPRPIWVPTATDAAETFADRVRNNLRQRLP